MSRTAKIWTEAIIALFLCVIAVVTLKIANDGFMKNSYPIEYENHVSRYSDEYGVDEALVFAVIRTESHFDPEAKSRVDARGLMQITPETFDWIKSKTKEKLDDEELFTPKINIKYGAKLLSMLYKEFDSTEMVLAAYHAGVGNARKWFEDVAAEDFAISDIAFLETRDYVTKVMDAINIYTKLYFMDNEEDVSNE